MRNAGEKQLRWVAAAFNAKHGYENQHSSFTGTGVWRSFLTRVPCWSGLFAEKPKSHHWRVFELAILIRLIIPGLKGVFSVLFTGDITLSRCKLIYSHKHRWHSQTPSATPLLILFAPYLPLRHLSYLNHSSRQTNSAPPTPTTASILIKHHTSRMQFTSLQWLITLPPTSSEFQARVKAL